MKNFMTIRLFLITIFFTCIFNVGKSQLSQRFIGTANRSEIVVESKSIPFNGIIAVGNSFLPSGLPDAIITRVDNSGNLMWQKQVSTVNDDRFTGVIPTFDGGFVAVGFINATSAFVNNTAIAVKYDALGNVIWTKTFNQSTQGEIFFDVVEMPITHNIVAVGATTFAPGSADTWVVVLDNLTGNVNWQRNYAASGTDYALAVSARNSEIILGGAFVGSTYTDVDLISVNENTGSLNWSKSYDYGSSLYSGACNGLLNIEVFGNRIYLNTQIGDSYSTAVFLTECIITVDTVGNDPISFEFGKATKPFCVWSTLKVIDSNNLYTVQNAANVYYNPQIGNTSSNFSANTIISKLKKIVPSQNALFKTKELISNGNTSFFGLDVYNNNLGAAGYTSGGTGQIGNLDINYLKADTSLNASNSCGFNDTVMNVGYPTISIGTYAVSNTLTNIGANNVQTYSSPIFLDTIYCGTDTNIVPNNNFIVNAKFNDSLLACSISYFFKDSSYSSNSILASWYWDFGDLLSATNNNSSLQNPTHTFSAAGTYTVTLYVSNTFGIIDTFYKTLIVSSSAIPTANAGSDINICQGGNASINASITGSSTSFIWTPTIGLSNATVLNPTASPNVTTTYSLVTSNLAGCHDTDDITVFVNTLPIVSAGNNLSFCDNTNGVQLNGSGIGTASWSPNTNLSNPNILNPLASPNSITNYTLTVTNANNCSATDVVQVSPAMAPIVSVSPNITICSGDSTTLIASGATNYFWSPTIHTIINNNQCIAFPTINTVYSVVGTTTNNCADTASVTVTILPVANLSISGDSLLCAGDTILLYANGATSYQWSPANLIISQIASGIVTSPLVSTIYTVSAVDNNNCKSSKTVNIIVDQIPNLQLTKSNDLQCAQTSSLLQASGALSYVWSPSATLNSATISNPTATPTATTTYSVLASGMACITIDSITVKVFNSIAEKTFVPSVFSPNGDGLNDCFTPISKSNFVNYSLKIYNRWGELVYLSNNANDCWDGQQKNGQIEIGTYFYILNAKTECSSIDWKGDITLIK
jgi:gliding motility-associated-like protein